MESELTSKQLEVIYTIKLMENGKLLKYFKIILRNTTNAFWASLQISPHSHEREII